MARRSTQPRELVRLSPLQFSLSISIVVVLLGAAGLAGYFYGLKQAIRMAAAEKIISQGHNSKQADPKPHQAGTNGSVTFYSALKEPRKDVPVPQAARPVEKTVKPVNPEPPEPQIVAPRVTEAAPGGGSVILQVASYKDRDAAGKLLEDLSSEGFAGTIVRADLGERGVWFRVRIGPYGEKDTRKILDRLREERKLKGYIVK